MNTELTLAFVRGELEKIYLMVAPNGCDLAEGIPWGTAKAVSELKARAEKTEAEVERLTELLRIESGAAAHALLWAEKAEADTARLDWLLARDVSLTIWHQGPNSGGASIATYSDRTAIDAAMKEDSK